MAQVPSNLIPTRITQLPVDPAPSASGILVYVRDGVTYQVQASEIVSVSGVPITRQVIAGTGLTGGGQLSSNVTLSIANGGVGPVQLADTGVTPGTYGDSSNIPVLTIDPQGRVTVATTIPATGGGGGGVPSSRQIIAGVGLNGGGTLASNVTLNANLSSNIPLAGDTTGFAGSSTNMSRDDHQHPAVNLGVDDEVDGILGLSNGGTARSLVPAAGAVVWSGGDGLYIGPVGSYGQVLVSGGSGAPLWGTAVVLVPQPANTVFAGPTAGPDANPTFRALVNADIPSTLSGKTITGATVTSSAITTSTINSTTIGATTPSTGVFTQLDVDNVRIDGNTVSTTDTNGNLNLTPNGTGDVLVNADRLQVGEPASAATITTASGGTLKISTNEDSNSGYVQINTGVNQSIDIVPDGTGQVNLATNVVRVGDPNVDATVTTDGLGDLILNTNAGTNSGSIRIYDGVDGNIAIAPNGAGQVQVDADTLRVGDSNANATITTNGTGDLVLNTNGGSNSGNITIQDGVDGNIVVTPNGNGDIQLDADTIRVGDAAANATITSNGTADLILNTNGGTDSGFIQIFDGVNGNIDITPNGTGSVNILKVNIDGGTIDNTVIGGVTPTTGSFTELNLDYADFTTNLSPLPTDAQGRLYYNNEENTSTLAFQMDAAIVQKIGEEQYFRVKAQSTITKGQVVMFASTVGASGGLIAAPATGLTADQANYILGIATETIATNNWGFVTYFGEVKGVNTTGGAEAWVDGTVLYYNPSVTGGLTKNKPTTPNAIAIVAAVVHAASNGILFVRPTFGSVLGGTDGNVQITSLTNGDILQYVGANSRWQNVAASSTTVGTANNLSGGAAGSIPYQTGAGVTAMLATSSGVLVGGTTPSYSTAPSLTGTNFTSIPNGALQNSSITLGTTSISLGGTATTLSGLTTVTVTQNPTAALQLATKQYVDNAVSSGITIHTPVRLESPDSAGSLNAIYAAGGTTPTVTDVAGTKTLTTSANHGLSVNDQIIFDSTSNGLTAGTTYYVYSTPALDTLTLSTAYGGAELTGLTNGTGLTLTSRANPGVGATLTNNGTLVALTVDGKLTVVADRILIYNQTNAYENGVYTVTTVGDGSTAWVLTRATDSDKYIPNSTVGMSAGDYFFVTDGDTGKGESYVLTTPNPITPGTTNLTYTQFSASQVYSAGTGLTLTGTTFSLTSPVLTSLGGTGLTSYTAGDLTYYASGTAFTKLGIGTNGKILKSTGSAPAWEDPANLAVSSISFGTTGLTPNTATQGAVTVAGTLITSNGGTGLSSYTAGDIVYYAAGTVLSKLAIGASTYIMTSSGTAPTWTNPSSITVGSATSATTANNIAGGAANQVPYQTGAGATTFSSAFTFDGTNLTLSNAIFATTFDTNVAAAGVTLAGTTLAADGTDSNITISITPKGTGSLSTTKLVASADSTFTSTGALLISKGTTAEQPGTPVTGMLRYNTTNNQFEGYSGSSPAWKSVGGASVSNDTSTATDLYPAFLNQTSGTAENLYTGNAKLLYKPSTGELKSSVPVASNGIFVNSATVADSYTIASGQNGFSVGPMTIGAGATVTVTSGQNWVII